MKILLAVLAALLTCSHPARADTIYTYTGNPFTSGCTGCSIYGDFVLAAALPANMPLSDIAPLQAGFSGGFGFPGNPLIEPIAQIDVATDASGNISAWDLNFYLRSGSYLISFNEPGKQTFDPDTQSDVDQFDEIAYAGSNFNTPGTWTVTQTGIPVASTPEPASILLACTGLLSIAASRYRRTPRST